LDNDDRDLSMLDVEIVQLLNSDTEDEEQLICGRWALCKPSNDCSLILHLIICKALVMHMAHKPNVPHTCTDSLRNVFVKDND